MVVVPTSSARPKLRLAVSPALDAQHLVDVAAEPTVAVTRPSHCQFHDGRCAVQVAEHARQLPRDLQAHLQRAGPSLGDRFQKPLLVGRGIVEGGFGQRRGRTSPPTDRVPPAARWAARCGKVPKPLVVLAPGRHSHPAATRAAPRPPGRSAAQPGRPTRSRGEFRRGSENPWTLLRPRLRGRSPGTCRRFLRPRRSRPRRRWPPARPPAACCCRRSRSLARPAGSGCESCHVSDQFGFHCFFR